MSHRCFVYKKKRSKLLLDSSLNIHLFGDPVNHTIEYVLRNFPNIDAMVEKYALEVEEIFSRHLRDGLNLSGFQLSASRLYLDDVWLGIVFYTDRRRNTI